MPVVLSQQVNRMTLPNYLAKPFFLKFPSRLSRGATSVLPCNPPERVPPYVALAKWFSRLKLVLEVGENESAGEV